MIPDTEVRVGRRVVAPAELPLVVTTQFMDFQVERVDRPDGTAEIWASTKTMDAFEIAFLRPGPTPTVVLMVREQLQGETRPKFPGGYLRPGTSMAEKIANDVGIEFDEADLLPAGHVQGHNTIKTPITLHWTAKWRQVNPPREGVTIREVALVEVVGMAVSHELECDSSFILAMRMDYLRRGGMLSP